MKMYSVTVENAKPADGLVSELDESSQFVGFPTLHQYNVAVLGLKLSGQSSLCQKLSKGTFLYQHLENKLQDLNVTFQQKNVKLYLFDLYGFRNNETLETDLKIIKNSKFVFIVFTLQQLVMNMVEIQQYIKLVKEVDENKRIVLLGTKIDEQENQLTPKLTKLFTQFANENNIKLHFFISAKTGDGIDQIQNMHWPDPDEYVKITIEKGCCK